MEAVRRFYTDFHIENELAYTRQWYTVKTALITNILVKKIGEDVVHDELKGHFENYGEVISVTFNDNDLCQSRSANVIFKDPKAAAKALTCKDQRKFTVTANDLWLQPVLDDTPAQDFENQSKFLMDLDDDTLLEIISYLNLQDQLALVLSHPRFLNVFKMFAKLKFKEVTTNTNLRTLSAYQIYKYLTIAGEYIQMFNLMDCHINTHLKLYCQLLTKYLPNLKVLFVTYLTESEQLNRILYSNPKLKALCLCGCVIKDKCAAAISSLPHLELLFINGCSHMTGEHLYLPNLKQLHIINCNGFVEFNCDMPALSTLSLFECTASYKDILRRCPNLEVINTDHLFDIKLHNLNKLSGIYALYDYPDDFLDQFTQQKINQIQTFGINCKNMSEKQKLFLTKFKNLKTLKLLYADDHILKILHTMPSLIEVDLSVIQHDEYLYDDEDEEKDISLSNHGLLELVKHCKNLKCIKVEYTTINHKFTEDLLPLIKETKRPNGQLTFYVYGSLIKKNYLSKEYFSDEIKPLVKFVFEETRTPFDGYLKHYFDFHYFSIKLPKL